MNLDDNKSWERVANTNIPYKHLPPLTPLARRPSLHCKCKLINGPDGLSSVEYSTQPIAPVDGDSRYSPHGLSLV